MSVIRATLTLRPATLADSDFLFRLRNEPSVWQWSRERRPVTLEEHAMWLNQLIDEIAPRLFVAEVDGRAVGRGQMTPDCEDPAGRRPSLFSVELSYSLIPELRGRGYGTALVAALVGAARAQGMRRCWAEVDEANLASLRCLERNGFGRPSKILERLL